MATPPSATSTWADFRARSRTFWIALTLGPVVAFLVAEFLLIERLGAPGLLWPLGAWLITVAWAGYRLQCFICPRCGNRFFRSSPPLLPIRAKRCAHCLLNKE